jgi:hypothetical protein
MIVEVALVPLVVPAQVAGTAMEQVVRLLAQAVLLIISTK